VPSPKARAPDLPDALDRLLRSMLAKMPDDRPASMEQVEAVITGIDDEADPNTNSFAATAPEMKLPRTTRMQTPRRLSDEVTIPTDLLEADGPTVTSPPPLLLAADQQTLHLGNGWRAIPPMLRTAASTHRRAVVAGGVVAAALLAVVVVARCGGPSVSNAPAKRPAPEAAVAPPEPPQPGVDVKPYRPDAQVAIVQPPPPPLDAAVVELAAIDAGQPQLVGPDAAAPRPLPHPTGVPRICVDEQLDLVKRDAKAAFESASYGAAATLYEELYSCGDAGALSMAYVSACHAHRFDDARQLFRKIGSSDREPFKSV
jgi:hypothetical protein